MNIILGVYGKSFDSIKAIMNAAAHYELDCDRLPTNHEEPYTLYEVNDMVKKAKSIHFDLTNIRFKLERGSFDRSITICELHLIITTPEYLAKTTFYKDGMIYPTEFVLNWFLFDSIWDKYAN